MVDKGIVLGHKVLGFGMSVDQAKIVVIEKLPPSIFGAIREKFSRPCGFLPNVYQVFFKDC